MAAVAAAAVAAVAADVAALAAVADVWLTMTVGVLAAVVTVLGVDDELLVEVEEVLVEEALMVEVVPLVEAEEELLLEARKSLNPPVLTSL